MSDLNYYERDGYDPLGFDMNLQNPKYPEVVSGKTDSSDTYTIIIKKEQIVYDVLAETGIVARARRSDAGVDLDLGDDIEERYRPLLNRWINFWTNKAADRMRAYLVTGDSTQGVDSIQDWREKHISLTFPDYWDSRVWGTLVDSVHEFIVRHVLYDYYRITLGEQDALTVATKQAAESAESDLKNCLMATKSGMVRKPFYPFPR